MKTQFIRSNAAPDEKDSPFFMENEKICQQWEQFIMERKGQIKGKYNSWSYVIHAKIDEAWLISVKKSTYSSGNLLLSSKHQNLQEVLTLETNKIICDCPNFIIRKRAFKDLFSSRKSSLNSKYSVFSVDVDHHLIKAITSLVGESLQNQSLYTVTYKDKNLKINLHHKNQWFQFIDKTLAFYYKEK